MKNKIVFSLLLLIVINGISQPSKFEYFGRLNPSVKKDKLNDAKFVTDLSPVLWHLLILPNKDRVELDEQRKLNYPLGFFAYPQGGYNTIVDYVSVEISTTHNGVVVTSTGAKEALTTEQKNNIKSADLGSDINVVIRFKYKKQLSNTIVANKLIEGNLNITVVPASEAEFPGGNKQLTNYLNENIFEKVSEKKAFRNLPQAVVKFSVDEHGKVMNVKMSRSSMDATTDLQIINAINKMPNWKPAKNSNGKNVAQEFQIPFGMSGGC
ncbi:MAG: energy transducer TonB [Bacteroidetes bacterium]|nr:energy transducer TonB [Bacteroidota bacterium]